MFVKDTLNKALIPLTKGDTCHWGPIATETSYLWAPFIGHAFWPEKYWIHHRQIPYLTLQVVDYGKMSIRSDSGKLMIPERFAVIAPPGEFTLTAVSPGGVQKRHIGFTGTLCLHHLHEFGLDRISVLSDFATPEFNAVFDELYMMASLQKQEFMQNFPALVYKMLLMISKKVETVHLPKQLIAAKSFIEWNFALNITLDEICSQVGCGRTKLQWQFGHYLGSTPMKYLMETRMKFAERALANRDLSIKAIADLCGYHNPLYFSNVFRSHFGCSPREYRKTRKPSVNASPSDGMPRYS